jgi:hypothetical protein
MRIKKHQNKNRYMLTEHGIWVRDFTQNNVVYEDINNLTESGDYRRLLENEHGNRLLRLPQVDAERPTSDKVLIVSNGMDFERKQQYLRGLPSDVTVIAVNGALADWTIHTGENRQRVHYYLVNNPYQECMSFYPRQSRYFPRCIASLRTFPEFTRQYSKKGNVCRYQPVSETNFSGASSDASYQLDDYRNPICAAVALAYQMSAIRVCLFCCDDSSKEDKPGMVTIDNRHTDVSSYTYPQQIVSHGIIDAQFGWLKMQEDTDVKLAYHSYSPEYSNATYIRADEVVDYFRGSA